MKLTAETAKATRAGDVLQCHVVRGLELHAKPSGRMWHFYYRFEGQRRRPKLGEFPEMGIEEARTIAKGWRLRINRGEDPSAEKAARMAAPTVSELCELYLSLPHQPGRLPWKPRTRAEYERQINTFIKPRIGSKKVADVTVAHVAELLEAVAAPKKRGHEKKATAAPIAANRVRACLSGIFKLAEHDDYKYRPKNSNPVKDTVKNREHKRKRHVTPAEFPAIARALDAWAVEYPSRVAAIRCMLFAGSRVTELLDAAPWQRQGNRVTLSKHKTERTGDDRVIILPSQAVKIISNLELRDGQYLFGEKLNSDHLKVVWNKVREEAGCPDLQMRDLRRTFASVAKSKGYGLDAIGELFGHKDNQTTRRYAWLFDDAGDTIAQSVADGIEKRMLGQ